MNGDARQRRLIIAMLAMGFIVAGWLVLQTVDRLRNLQTQQIETNDFIAQIRAINRLSEKPSIAALRNEPPDEIGRRVSRAMEAAGIAASTMRSTTPMAASRIDRTAYLSRLTNVRLDGITLPQTLAFCDAVIESSDGLTVTDLRLSQPEKSTANNAASAPSSPIERWNVELTLTQIIYSPIAKSPRRTP